MTWYAAHVIMYVRFKDGQQDGFPVWENIFLVQAETEDSGRAKAETLGHAAEGDSEGSFKWEKRPAEWVFAGVRKLVKCDSDEDSPGDGTEITYSELAVATEEALRDLANGRPAKVDQYD